MRKLPIIFLLDVSESMAGPEIEALQNAVQTIASEVRRDPNALETVHMGVVAFAGVSRILVNLTEVASFRPPALPIGSGTNLAAGLERVMEMIDGQVTRATESERGDWKPVVYTLTDGRPTTDISAAAERWRTKYANRADLIGIAIGQFADLSSLAQITDNVIVFNPKEPGDLGDLVKWVSASISIQSTSLEATTGVNLAKTEGLDLSFLDNLTSPLSVDEKVAVVPAKCASQGKNYVLKYANPYAKFPELHEEIKAQFGDREVYLLEGAFPVGDDYHAWSDPSLAAAVINTNKLLGATQCPICGAPHAFAICSCGIVHCVQGTGTAQCPGCGKHSNYDVAPPDDEGDEISRGLG